MSFDDGNVLKGNLDSGRRKLKSNLQIKSLSDGE